ncbi:MAG TPA: CHAP domain-containing protein [Polyangiaceae bacterium]
MNRSLVSFAKVAITLVATSGLLMACSAAPEENDGSTDDGSNASYASDEEELTSSTVDGDWRKFPNGQCLVAVQGFYPAKFGVSLPVAGPGSYGSCASYGACKLWVDPAKEPSSSEWERIPNDGKHKPVTYDLIVYPPISGDPWGHIASVDHVDGKNIYVMDSNYVAHERKAPLPHTVSWPAFGWYHLKKLGPSPAASVDCVPGGFYCGGDKVKGDPDNLYKCNAAGDGQTLSKACKKGCRVNEGRDDACN